MALSKGYRARLLPVDLPIALAFLFVCLYSVNVVFWDQWGVADKLDALFSGTLSVPDLLAFSFGGQGGLHNPFFSRIAMLLLAVAMEYNNLVEMYLILACFLVTLVCLLLVFKGSIMPRLSPLVVRAERATFILATYESQPAEFLRALDLRPELVRSVAPTLEGLGYYVFSEPRPRVLPPSLCALSIVPSSTLSKVESISGVGADQETQLISIPADESFVAVTGWAVDADDEAGGVYVDMDGTPFPAFYGTDKNVSDKKSWPMISIPRLTGVPCSKEPYLSPILRPEPMNCWSLFWPTVRKDTTGPLKRWLSK